MRWIIGDIHGMLHPLEVLLEAVTGRDPDAHFFFTGDYCDRGPDTKGVVDLVIRLFAEGRATGVRGNHDDIFDLCLNRQSLASGPNLGGEADDAAVTEAADFFWREGIVETMYSYGVDLTEVRQLLGQRDRIDAWVREQFDRVPEAHKQFFRELPPVAESQGFFVVHALWPPDYLDETGRMLSTVTGDEYLRYDTLWGRYNANQIRSRKVWSRRAYVGHTPTDTYLGQSDLIAQSGDIIRGEKLTLVDTACFSPGGRLSAVCHDSGEVVQVHRTGELLD